MKNFIYVILKYIGIFKISKYLFRKKLLILTYHGFEIHDECSFCDNTLFIRAPMLDEKMKYLKDHNFNVISLNDAYNCLISDKVLPDNSIVITVDDGWYSTLSLADPIFEKYDFPYTIYVSTYYCIKETPILNIVLRYLIWAYKSDYFDSKQLNITAFSKTYSLKDTHKKSELEKDLFDYFNKLESHEQRHDFIKKLMNVADIDYDQIQSDRRFSTLTFAEVKMLSDKGVDIQLHTHRHCMPFEKENGVEKEINDNRDCLAPFVKNKLNHFCYPSGVYNHECEQILKKCDVLTATTCDNGFVTAKNNVYYWPRFLDGVSIPQIVFEAEVCGINEIFRKIRSVLKPSK